MIYFDKYDDGEVKYPKLNLQDIENKYRKKTGNLDKGENWTDIKNNSSLS